VIERLKSTSREVPKLSNWIMFGDSENSVMKRQQPFHAKSQRSCLYIFAAVLLHSKLILQQA
jgi:hypothetical protein